MVGVVHHVDEEMVLRNLLDSQTLQQSQPTTEVVDQRLELIVWDCPWILPNAVLNIAHVAKSPSPRRGSITKEMAVALDTDNGEVQEVYDL